MVNLVDLPDSKTLVTAPLFQWLTWDPPGAEEKSQHNTTVGTRTRVKMVNRYRKLQGIPMDCWVCDNAHYPGNVSDSAPWLILVFRLRQSNIWASLSVLE
jgi:hypothetical protein